MAYTDNPAFVNGMALAARGFGVLPLHGVNRNERTGKLAAPVATLRAAAQANTRSRGSPRMGSSQPRPTAPSSRAGSGNTSG